MLDQLHPHHMLGSKVTWVKLPTEFDNLLLNAAGYFDVSPKSSPWADTGFLKGGGNLNTCKPANCPLFGKDSTYFGPLSLLSYLRRQKMSLF